MSSFDFTIHPHRRFNPLTREWVLVSPHRTQRPWQGQVEDEPPAQQPSYDPNCYLCPGNERAGSYKNPSYTNTVVFDNDFAALKSDTPAFEHNESNLLIAQSEAGQCRVVCFSPRHDLTIARMALPDLRRVVNVWAEEFIALGNLSHINSVQIFENRGAMMGCSNPHPHGQIWANLTIPNKLQKELSTQKEYYAEHGESLLGAYLQIELQKNERVVCANDHFVGVVPYWATWPFETLVISRRPVTGLDQLNDDEQDALADILRQMTIRYDNLFRISFPYTMGFHQRPTDGAAHPEFQLHAHFYPPLLRSATVKKFMVGYEMLAMPQRDITPEMAADWLRNLPAQHYLDNTL